MGKGLERLTNQFSVMGRKYDLAYGQANTWKRKLKNDKYELIENAIDKLGQYEDIDESPEHLAKVKKAFEIIKKEKVDISILYQSENLEDYNSRIIISYSSNSKLLTQEEYDLLEEVLCEKEQKI